MWDFYNKAMHQCLKVKANDSLRRLYLRESKNNDQYERNKTGNVKKGFERV